jgi:hypothetical protein
MSKLRVPPNIFGTNQPDLVQGISTYPYTGDGHIGIEVLTNGIIDTRGRNDTIIGEADMVVEIATGISNSGTIKTGSGDDTITGTGKGGGVVRYRFAGTGIFNSSTGSISAGSGNDTITGIGDGGSDTDDGKALGISNQGKISGDAGNDNIKGIGTGGMYGGDGIGILNSGHISGGTGNDAITGNGTGFHHIFGFTGGDGIGISNTGEIDGNTGNDKIIGTGTGGEGGADYFDRRGTGGQGIGILNAGTIRGGAGDDLISGLGTGGKGGESEGIGGDGIGISNSSHIYGDNGNDIIKGIGIGGLSDSAANGRGVGIFNQGRINGGAGQDKILGYGTSVGIEGNGVNVVGIDGGAGDDLFKARKITGLDAKDNPIESSNQDGAIANIFISGGQGNDIFDVGFGTAKLDGGQGWDTLILPVLGSGTYSIGRSSTHGWLEITNNASTNVLSVSNFEKILSGGATLFGRC